MQDRKLEYVYSAAIAIAIFGASTSAMAQTGVDDDRVSLPAGPGWIEGVGENASINPVPSRLRVSCTRPREVTSDT